MLRMIGQDKSLHIHRLSDEIGERLRLDHLARPKLDGVGAELDHPFYDAAVGFLIVKDITEGEFSGHGDLVVLEVMAELVGCGQDCVQQLLDMGVLSLGLIQDLADEVNRSLDLVHMSSLLALDNDSRANNLRGRSDVDQ